MNKKDLLELRLNELYCYISLVENIVYALLCKTSISNKFKVSFQEQMQTIRNGSNSKDQ